MSGIIAGAAIVGASAIGKGVYGAVQTHKANNIDKNNTRPTEQVDPIYQQNVNQADQMARHGLPQAVINNQMNAINQNQAGAIGALSNSANPGASLASVVRQGNAASANLNAQDAAARNKNTLALIQQRGILAGAKQNAWNYNYADKYSENLAKSQALRGAGTQNIAGGLNTLGQAGMGVLGGMSGGAPSTSDFANRANNPVLTASGVGVTPEQGNWNNFSMSGGNQNTFQ